MRRFELIEGNKARFWEIERYDDVIVTRSGIIGKKPREREKEFRDDMAAEVAFDQQIHAKRRQGWVEAKEASAPLEPFAERAVELRPLDGSDPERFDGEAMRYLLRRMVDVQMLDRHREPPDLSRWEERACRRARVDEVPAKSDEAWASWHQEFLAMTRRDRAAPMEDHLVGAFKFRQGSHWIVTPEECQFIAAEGPNRPPKRRKTTEEQAAWVERFCAFNERASKQGYEVVPV